MPKLSSASSGLAKPSRIKLLRNTGKFTRRYRKRIIRYGLLAGNLAIVLMAVLMVVNNSGGTAATNFSALSTASETKGSNPLDTLSATDIAANVAIMARLPETGLIINEADSVNAQLHTPVSSGEAVLKPQILSSDIKTKADIQEYTVAQGDTLSSLAAKFGVTSDSIRWSNNLSTTNLRPGTILIIPPVNGIAYTVKSGDTAETLGSRYNVPQEQIIRFNDAELTGLVVNERIVIPGGTVRAAPRSSTPYYAGFAFGNSAIYGYNGYVPGYCTWYVANKRAQIGRPLPANLGNAGPWARSAPRAGFRVDNIPAVGAVAVTDTRNPGHVAFVEEVRADGSILISEMNFGRRFQISTRTFDAAQAARIVYIH